jgi:CTP:molybdopterin cytidylyltransferase MocA
MKPRDIVPILLAAGSSHLLGAPRPLARFGRRSALQIALANCRGLARPILVLGCDASIIRPRVPRGVRIVLNRRWRSGGQLSSLLAALRHVPSSSAFLLYPIDLPLLQPHTIQTLVRAFLTRQPHQQIVLPRHGRETGHPILVSAALRSEFQSAPTARHVIYKNKRRILQLPVPTTSIFTDFSTPDSYLSCLNKFLSRRG